MSDRKMSKEEVAAFAKKQKARGVSIPTRERAQKTAAARPKSNPVDEKPRSKPVEKSVKPSGFGSGHDAAMRRLAKET